MDDRSPSDGDDYPGAAGKHLADASTLFSGGRYDGAAYLAGYLTIGGLRADGVI